ncbi:cysteine synthase A [Desulfuribacillus alkaliarsenatis]|uniref:Cysteine synthase n=1 Tax=Desulfuribacillus alkaliarsenatis TaxID=766136 RepID=A0A1E5G511_9FIRM|nr:cysteine synthase A [Desulfuribacillus alkaliarsenatis]OEF98253.1 cysteine synthase A [Desulfuribacillus alkaliarsenatis]
MKVVNNITELVGNTPLVKLNRVVHANSAEVYAKLEFFNPTKSVKDRAALNMFMEAEKQGLINKDSTIIEPTSGNTGIGLAMVGAALGYRTILVMPDSMTLERILILKAYGAEVVLTPGDKRMPGAIEKAEQLLAEIPNSFMPQQFNNLANPDIHRTTTALEILRELDGKLDAFVATAGTGGTITGTGETLKQQLPEIEIHVVEPQGSPVLSGGEPGSHKIIGTSPGFVPSILNQKIYDEIHLISDEDAIQMTKDLARKEGILVGVSGGAAIFTAVKVAAKLSPEQKVVVIAPDTGERYLSMGFFG